MDATNAFVLDGSVTMVWGFDDEADTYAEAILEKMPDLQAHVPSLWPLEVANVDRRRTPEANHFGRFGTVPGNPDRLPHCRRRQDGGNAWSDTMHLARAHILSAYDATYPELAIRLGLPLATLDGKLRAAALTIGVPLFDSQP